MKKKDIPAQDAPSPAANTGSKAMYVIGIGASAGGMEAVTKFLLALPSNTGMAFIYVQHLSPDFKSMLAHLLSRSTYMTVKKAGNNMPLMADHFYVIPHDKDIVIEDGHILLHARTKKGAVHHPIDKLFKSLAESHREEAIGIVLSGSLSDGTMGLKAIREAGGLTFAQDDSALFEGMPKSAIASGVVDFVLSPPQIARQLLMLSSHSLESVKELMPQQAGDTPAGNEDLHMIMDLLQKKMGRYDPEVIMSTMKRGILRRLILNTIKELSANNEELQARNDLVTEVSEYSQAILDTIHEGLLVLDKTLRIRTANKVFYERFKEEPGHTEGRLLYELDGGQWNIPQLRALLEGVLSKKKNVYNFEITHDFKELGRMALLINASRINQKEDKEELILLAISDVTQSHSMRMRQQELERMVNEKTEQLLQANEELRRKNMELQRSVKELATFAYVASHDLQEPLRIIRSFSKIIEQKETDKLSKDGKDHFFRIQDGVKRMQRLIDDLLIYSRTNSEEKKYTKIDLLTTLAEIKVVMGKEITERSAVIDISGTCELNVVLTQFRQMLTNIIGNALKFARHGVAPHIVITNSILKGSDVNNDRLHGEKEYCRISIQDYGIGFEQRFSERIFEVFQRLHSRDQYSGTGVGLAIVKKAAENMGGIVTASGEPGVGATFDVYIPLS